MMKRIVGLGLVCLGISLGAVAAEYKAEMTPSDPAQKALEGLTFGENQLEIETKEEDGVKKIYGLIKGTYKREEWNITINKKKLEVTEAGEFSLAVPVEGTVTEVKFVAIGPTGEVEEYPVKVTFSEFVALQEEIQQDKVDDNRKRHFFNAGLAPSFVSYSDERINKLSQISLTVKGGYNFAISDAWRVGASAYFTAVPFRLSGGDPLSGSTGAAGARFLGVNVRGGWKTPFLKGKTTLYLYAGIYYTTMMVSTDSYGFQNMQGPQLFPVVTHDLANGSTITAYAKFSPVTSDFSFQNLSNNEIAFGGAFYFKPGTFLLKSETKRVGLTLDLAIMNLEIQGIEIQTLSVSAGMAVAF